MSVCVRVCVCVCVCVCMSVCVCVCKRGWDQQCIRVSMHMSMQASYSSGFPNFPRGLALVLYTGLPSQLFFAAVEKSSIFSHGCKKIPKGGLGPGLA